MNLSRRMFFTVVGASLAVPVIGMPSRPRGCNHARIHAHVISRVLQRVDAAIKDLCKKAGIPFSELLAAVRKK